MSITHDSGLFLVVDVETLRRVWLISEQLINKYTCSENQLHVQKIRIKEENR